MSVKHLSASSVGTYIQCPRKWRFRYLDEVRVPVGPALPFGSAAHEVIEGRIRDGGGASLIDRWTRRWRDEIENQKISWGRKTEDAMLAKGQRIFSAPEVISEVSKIQALEDRGEPYIEHFFKFEIDRVEVPVIGYVDIIEEDRIACDIKTSSRSWDEVKARKELQPPIYVSALQASGVEIESRFRFRVLVKSGKPEMQEIEIEVGQDRIDWTVDLIRSVWRGVQAKVFPACSPMAWWCDPDYCGYWKHCKRI